MDDSAEWLERAEGRGSLLDSFRFGHLAGGVAPPRHLEPYSRTAVNLETKILREGSKAEEGSNG